jgi:hypothetical protein
MAGTLDDEAFLTAFRNATLPSKAFNHEAHLRLAWLHLQRSPVKKAIRDVQEQIQRYALSLGATDKYHCTLTVASMKLVQERSGGTEIGFEEFRNRHPELLTEFKGLLLRHYSEARLFSPEARMHYLEPDLLPFDLP